MTTGSPLSADTQALMTFEANKKSMGVSYLLWFFLGGLGGHRFYLGRTGSAVVILLMSIFGWMLILAAGLGLLLLIPLGIWLLIDAFLIPGMVNGHNNALMARLNSPSRPSVSPVEELAQYAGLHDRGAISDEEYAVQKARILG